MLLLLIQVITRLTQLPKALDPMRDSFYSPSDWRGISRPILFWGKGFSLDVRAISSVVEHFVDIEGVTSSNLVSPTMNSPFWPWLKHPQTQWRKACAAIKEIA